VSIVVFIHADAEIDLGEAGIFFEGLGQSEDGIFRGGGYFVPHEFSPGVLRTEYCVFPDTQYGLCSTFYP
jgi:hypothetical protein